MTIPAIALFGEAEKGTLGRVYFCHSLPDLFGNLGEPPKDTLGIHFAVQTLLYKTPVMYFRVRQEGVSLDDYFYGLSLLRKVNSPVISLRALFLPGVGSKRIIEESISVCREFHSLLIVNESDFYDYMTDALPQKTLT